MFLPPTPHRQMALANCVAAATVALDRLVHARLQQRAAEGRNI
jgi:hypothetical protein